MRKSRQGNRVGALDGEAVGLNPLEYLDDKFSGYIAERRREPRNDVLGGMAAATYPDGSIPEILEVAGPPPSCLRQVKRRSPSSSALPSKHSATIRKFRIAFARIAT